MEEASWQRTNGCVLLGDTFCTPQRNYGNRRPPQRFGGARRVGAAVFKGVTVSLLSASHCVGTSPL